MTLCFRAPGEYSIHFHIVEEFSSSELNSSTGKPSRREFYTEAQPCSLQLLTTLLEKPIFSFIGIIFGEPSTLFIYFMSTKKISCNELQSIGKHLLQWRHKDFALLVGGNEGARILLNISKIKRWVWGAEPWRIFRKIPKNLYNKIEF